MFLVFNNERSAMTDSLNPIVLASARRAELLQQLQVNFCIHVVDIDETPRPEEAPDFYVMRMAAEKAHTASASSGLNSLGFCYE